MEGIIQGAYLSQGRVCSIGSRLLVQESIVDPVMRRRRDRLRTLRVGDPLDQNTDIGAVNRRAQLEKIREMVASGKKEVRNYSSLRASFPVWGYFYAPSCLPE